MPSLTYVIEDIGPFGSTTIRLEGNQAADSMRDGRENIMFGCPLPRAPKNLRALRSPISAKEVLGRVQGTGLDPSILSHHNPRWERLHSGEDPGMDCVIVSTGPDVSRERRKGKEKGLTTPHQRETIAACDRPASLDEWEDAR